MKCPHCNKEYTGKICPYCEEPYVYEEKKIKKVSKTSMLLAIITVVLAFISFKLPIFILVSVFGVIAILSSTKKEEKNYRNGFIFTSVVIVLLLIFSLGTYVTPYYEQYFGYKKIEKTLNIDLPNEKTIDYEYESGFDNQNISYTYFLYSITNEEYQKLKNNEYIHEYQNDWYIKNVSSLEEDYIIYDYINEKLDSPKNKLEYHYMFVQVEENNGEYFAHVYKVTKRGY